MQTAVATPEVVEAAAPAATEAISATSAHKYKWSLVLFYTSHFLFTWNDRVWEFASVILLIAAYPMTLLPSSVFGLSSTASAIIFGPGVGRLFDSTPRLKSVRCAIFVQRIVVSAGCICLWVMISHSPRGELKNGLFAVVILLGCFARLAFVGKTAGIERDWAVVISRSQDTDLNSTILKINVLTNRYECDNAPD
jgi:solute carrier family 40 (iron-regulated transporter), member 1